MTCISSSSSSGPDVAQHSHDPFITDILFREDPMEYLGSIVQRSRRPITVLASVLGGGYLAVSYLRSKLDEMQDSLTRTRACTENLRRRFEQNQQDCSFTVLALIPTLGKQVIHAMNVERLVELLSHTKLRQTKPNPSLPSTDEQQTTDNPIISNGTGDPNHATDGQSPDSSIHLNGASDSNSTLTVDHTPLPQDFSELLVRPDGTTIQKRSEIWREMMIVSFSRLFTCLYGLTLLTLQTHVQLGLLGRDSYLSSILSSERVDYEESEGASHDDNHQLDLSSGQGPDPLGNVTERRYLTFSYWYLHQGWMVLSRRTRNAVTDVLSSRSLKDLVSASDLQEIFDLIRKGVELEPDGTEFNFAPILLPTNAADELQTLQQGGMSLEECEVDERLRALLDETQDFIDCPDFRLVLSSAMGRIVDLSVSNIARSASLDVSDRCYPTICASSRFSQLDSSDGSQPPPSSAARLVEMLPVISKESLEILKVIPNDYLETICETVELKEFSSVIYTTFEK